MIPKIAIRLVSSRVLLILACIFLLMLVDRKLQFSNNLKLQDFSIYIKSTEWNLKNSDLLFPHQLTYLGGQYGFFDDSSHTLLNWGTPASEICILPFLIIGEEYRKFAYLVLLFFSPVAIWSLMKVKPGLIGSLIPLGAIFSNLAWGGMGSVIVWYAFLIIKFRNYVISQLFAVVLLLYKPQLVAIPVAFMFAYYWQNKKLRSLLPFFYFLVLLPSLSILLSPQAWINWLKRDFSIPFLYIKNSNGPSGLFFWLGFEYYYQIAFIIFLFCVSVSLYYGAKLAKSGVPLTANFCLGLLSIGVLVSPYVWLHDWLINSIWIVAMLQISRSYRVARQLNLVLIVLFGTVLLEVIAGFQISVSPIRPLIFSFFFKLIITLRFLFLCYHMHHVPKIEREGWPTDIHQGAC